MKALLAADFMIVDPNGNTILVDQHLRTFDTQREAGRAGVSPATSAKTKPEWYLWCQFGARW